MEAPHGIPPRISTANVVLSNVTTILTRMVMHGCQLRRATTKSEEQIHAFLFPIVCSLVEGQWADADIFVWALLLLQRATSCRPVPALEGVDATGQCSVTAPMVLSLANARLMIAAAISLVHKTAGDDWFGAHSMATGVGMTPTPRTAHMIGATEFDLFCALEFDTRISVDKFNHALRELS